MIKAHRLLAAAVALTAAAAWTSNAWAQSSREIKTHIVQPEQMAPDLSKLKVPEGFKIDVFSQAVKAPRIIQVAADGCVYVTSRELGTCTLLKDTDGDGRPDEQKIVARRNGLHGLAISPDQTKAYFVTVRELYEVSRNADGTFGEPKKLVDDLPDAGQHPNRTLAFGPDGMIYLSVGSTTNAANEPNPECATMLKLSPDATSRTIVMRGLRNTIGFDWHPKTKDFWGMDHGIDYLGVDVDQSEELNHLIEGKHYGWPIVYNDGKVNIQPPPPHDTSREQWVKTTEKPVLTYTPHAAPMQMIFYTGAQFPKEFQNDAFVTMRGSWNANPPTGYEIVRVRFDPQGKPVRIEPFITGFLTKRNDGNWAHMGRLVGLAQMKDGSLLVSDDTNHVIYRISHTNTQRAQN